MPSLAELLANQYRDKLIAAGTLPALLKQRFSDVQNPEWRKESLSNFANQLIPPRDPQGLAEWAMNFSPMGVAGVVKPNINQVMDKLFKKYPPGTPEFAAWENDLARFVKEYPEAPVKPNLAHTWEFPLREASEDQKGKGLAGLIAPGVATIRPYKNTPNSLMGYAEKRPWTQKGYGEQNWPHEIKVKVTFPDGDSFVDGMEGLNKSHALERAYRNWGEDAKIEVLDSFIKKIVKE